MQISQNTSKWYQNLWAALMFFTRLPLWRIYQPPKNSFTTVVEYWPFAGWITGGLTALSLFIFLNIFPTTIAVVLSICVRLLITGGLHEDGLADFFDGFGGGGNDRERILSIMKDHHNGSYATISLIIYFILLVFSLSYLPKNIVLWTIIAGDPFSKMLTAQLTQILPYARTEEQSKAKIVYRKMKISSAIALTIGGLLPLINFYFQGCVIKEYRYLYIMIPALVYYALYMFIQKKIKGYTGDCCGGVCLLVELSFYLTTVAFYYIHTLK